MTQPVWNTIAKLNLLRVLINFPGYPLIKSHSIKVKHKIRGKLLTGEQMSGHVRRGRVPGQRLRRGDAQTVQLAHSLPCIRPLRQRTSDQLGSQQNLHALLLKKHELNSAMYASCFKHMTRQNKKNAHYMPERDANIQISGLHEWDGLEHFVSW